MQGSVATPTQGVSLSLATREPPPKRDGYKPFYREEEKEKKILHSLQSLCEYFGPNCILLVSPSTTTATITSCLHVSLPIIITPPLIHLLPLHLLIFFRHHYTASCKTTCFLISPSSSSTFPHHLPSPPAAFSSLHYPLYHLHPLASVYHSLHPHPTCTTNTGPYRLHRRICNTDYTCVPWWSSWCFDPC